MMSQLDEFQYLLRFAEGSFLDEEICREQLRCLWTAYCFHNSLDVDTLQYDLKMQELWDLVSTVEDDTAEWSDFDSFDNFMCAHMV